MCAFPPNLIILQGEHPWIDWQHFTAKNWTAFHVNRHSTSACMLNTTAPRADDARETYASNPLALPAVTPLPYLSSSRQDKTAQSSLCRCRNATAAGSGRRDGSRSGQPRRPLVIAQEPRTTLDPRGSVPTQHCTFGRPSDNTASVSRWKGKGEKKMFIAHPLILFDTTHVRLTSPVAHLFYFASFSQR